MFESLGFRGVSGLKFSATFLPRKRAQDSHLCRVGRLQTSNFDMFTGESLESSSILRRILSRCGVGGTRHAEKPARSLPAATFLQG